MIWKRNKHHVREFFLSYSNKRIFSTVETTNVILMIEN